MFLTPDLLAIVFAAIAVTITDGKKGNLEVTIYGADLVGSGIIFWKPDCYVNVTAIGKMEQITRMTSVVDDSYKPVWNETLDFCYGNWRRLEISVHDDDLWNDDVVIPVFTKSLLLGLGSGKPQEYFGPEGKLFYMYEITSK